MHKLDKHIRFGFVRCFGGGGSLAVTQTTVPSSTSAEVEAAREKERLLARQRRGRQSTMLSDEDNTGQAAKTLLGQ